jgi:hypothetical protein
MVAILVALAYLSILSQLLHEYIQVRDAALTKYLHFQFFLSCYRRGARGRRHTGVHELSILSQLLRKHAHGTAFTVYAHDVCLSILSQLLLEGVAFGGAGRPDDFQFFLSCYGEDGRGGRGRGSR